MSLLRRFAAFVLATCSCMFAAHATLPSTPIPVYGTGVAPDGSLVADGLPDPHYRIVYYSAGNSQQQAHATYVVSDRAGGSWRSNEPNAKWIAPEANQALAPPVCRTPGDYGYRTTFDLSGLDPASAVITGAWATDNTGIDIYLNGQSKGFTAAGYSFLAPFSITTGFVPGINRLDFIVRDGGCPTGVQIVLGGTANGVPAQAITFGQLVNRPVGSAPFNLGAFASSGLPVSYTSLTPGTCTVSGSTVTLVAAGGCQVAADQAGDASVAPAPRETRAFFVEPAAYASKGVALAAGAMHACAITAVGGVKCWGEGRDGQLGDGSLTSRNVPVDVAGLGSGVRAITAGTRHTCALLDSGGVKCWGSGPSGELGNGSRALQPTPVDVAGLTGGVAAITAGQSHTCALLANGSVKCWGDRFSGQVGDAGTGDALSPVDVTGLGAGAARSLAAGGYHTCAVSASGTTQCWGANNRGQLGDGTSVNRSTPVEVRGLARPLVALEPGHQGHTCAVTQAGGAQCWGANEVANLGVGISEDLLAPFDVTGLDRGVAAVAAGSGHSCALLHTGEMRCWGGNLYGQLGIGPGGNGGTPVAVTGLASVTTAMAAGYDFTCALSQQGAVRCWGNNNAGQLGDGTDASARLTPVGVVGLTGAAPLPQAIAFGRLRERGLAEWPFTLSASATSGLPVAFASSTPQTCSVSGASVQLLAEGVCGIVATQDGGPGFDPAEQVERSFAVVTLTNPAQVASISLGREHECLLMANGAVACRGRNGVYQLGNGSTTDSAALVVPTGLSAGNAAVAAGRNANCTLLEGTGEVKCWGSYSGAGPTPIRKYSQDVVSLAAGYAKHCAVFFTGEVSCWDQLDFLTGPIQLGGPAIGVAIGSLFDCAVMATGALRCWGYDINGELGDGDVAHGGQPAPPVDVEGLSSRVLAVAAGATHACALIAGGSVKCWGQNASGQLGIGTTNIASRNAPADVVGLPGGVVAIAADANSGNNNSHNCALLAQGTVWCWGNNFSGQLGDGSFVTRSQPVEAFEFGNNVVAIAVGGGRTCAVTTDGGVICRGLNPLALPDLSPPLDRAPDPFGFAARTGVQIVSTQTSEPVVPTGFYDPAEVSVSQGQYSIGCTGTFTTAVGTIRPTQSICVRHVAAPGYNSSLTTTLTVGSVVATFTTTTGRPPILTPNSGSFYFGAVPVGQSSAPQVVTIVNTGEHAASDMAWGADGNFFVSSVNCGSTLAVNAQCQLSVTFTPNAPGALAGELLLVAQNAPVPGRASLVGNGTVTDATPDPFAFTDQFLVPVSTVVTSAPVAIKGLASPASISVAGGSYCISSGPSCSCDVQAFTAVPSTIANNQGVCVRHTSSAVPGGSNDTTLFVGGLADVFTSVTVDTVPAGFALAAQSNVPPNTMRTSAAVAITGINAPTPFSASGGEVSINCTGAFTASGTLAPGSALCARHVAAPGYNASRSTTVTVGGVSAVFTSTTFDAFGDADNDGIPNGVEFNEARNPEAKDNDVFGSARLFAMQQYRDFLGREGDAGGLQFYVDLIATGAAERANVIESFFNSPEFSGTVAPIARLYFATFRRVPDYEGLLFQVNAYRSGAPLAGIATNFTLSPEFQATYGNKTDTEYVQLLYQNVLGRTASAGEIDFHVNRLVAGASRGDVLVGFSESPEYQQATFNEVYVTMMYVGMLRRAPDPAGFDYWLAYMDGGNPGLALILGFLQAPEYRTRFLP